MQIKARSFLPTIADCLFLIIFLRLSLCMGQFLLLDADTGLHIRAGEIMIQQRQILQHDLFSFFTPPLSYIPWDWLSEIIMGWIHSFSGLTGIVIFFSFLIAATQFLFFRVLQKESNLFTAILLWLLALPSVHLHWLARPLIFSQAIFVVFYFLLNQFHYRGKSWLAYYLFFLMIAWVNLHGAFILGIVLIALYLAGTLIEYFFASADSKKANRNQIKNLLLLFGACVAASLVNPQDYRILRVPFEVITDKFLQNHIQEFRSPDFHNPYVFHWFSFIALAVFAFAKKRPHAVEILLIIFFMQMALYSRRHIPYFVIVTAVTLARHIGEISIPKIRLRTKPLKTKIEAAGTVDRSAIPGLWSLVGVAAVVTIAFSGKISYAFDPDIAPVNAVEFIQNENISGNMLNWDEFGDYIIYKAWPRYKVANDGRGYMYGSEKIRDFDKVFQLKPDWENIIEKYNINWIFYKANTPLSLFLLERDDWKLIYADKVANIFVRNTAGNQSLIKKYTDVKLDLREKKRSWFNL